MSDWGIARELDTRGFATPQCYPCLAHLAPEVLLQGKLCKVRACFQLLAYQPGQPASLLPETRCCTVCISPARRVRILCCNGLHRHLSSSHVEKTLS